MSLLPLLIATLSSAMVYALLALGTVLVYRTSRVLLFCGGEIGMLAAFVLRDAWSATLPGPAGFAIGVATALALSLAVGALLCWLVEGLGRDGGHFTGTIITVAVAVALVGLMAAIWQGGIFRLPIRLGFVRLLDTRFSLTGPAVIGVGAALLGLVLLLLTHSAIGTDTQALADDRRLALLRGVPVRSSLLIVWSGAAMLSAAGGMLSGALSSISVEGAVIGLSGVVAALIGGLTSPAGAILGALALAAAENLTIQLWDARYSEVVPVLALVLLLVARPSGFSGRAESIARI